MTTLRQIQRLWDARQYEKLLVQLLENRLESSARLRSHLSGSLAAAALGLIRLEELDQAGASLAQEFLRRLLLSQNTEGGWDDPLTTALSVRALTCSAGQGPAVERGITYLANLQKSDGSWPREPIRRLASDGFVSAFILFQLGRCVKFQDAVRIDEAVSWFERNHAALEVETKRLWIVAAARTKPTTAHRRFHVPNSRVSHELQLSNWS